ncbi:hypothetical protein HCN44_003329 [Aphidius gifuensis]|uniref:BEN domain-containing protein n=1 Tax=Aphidius gifuensis TaxID=684658 RepID=A0A834XZU3_APHGI|nr:hypothetical protein HCN44_003329 [Aphidius gifuensis]
MPKAYLALVKWVGGKYKDSFTPGVPVSWIENFDRKKFDNYNKDNDEIIYTVEWKEKKIFKKYKVNVIMISDKMSELENKIKILDGDVSPKALKPNTLAQYYLKKQKLFDDDENEKENDISQQKKKSTKYDIYNCYCLIVYYIVFLKIEIGQPGSDVTVTDLQWTTAISRGSYKFMSTSLVMSLFPMNVLLKSNYKGGKCKIKKDETPQKLTALDTRIVDAIKYSVQRKFKNTFTLVGFGQAINSKLHKLRSTQNQSKEPSDQDDI